MPLSPFFTSFSPHQAAALNSKTDKELEEQQEQQSNTSEELLQLLQAGIGLGFFRVDTWAYKGAEWTLGCPGARKPSGQASPSPFPQRPALLLAEELSLLSWGSQGLLKS